MTSTVWDYTAQGVVDAITRGLYPGDILPFNVTIAEKSYPTLYLSVGGIDTCEDCSSMLSAGETVGLSIAMFIGGWVFAIVLSIILCLSWNQKHKPESANKSFSATAVSYGEHESEGENEASEIAESATDSNAD